MYPVSSLYSIEDEEVTDTEGHTFIELNYIF